MQKRYPALIAVSPFLIGLAMAIGYFIGTFNSEGISTKNKPEKNDLLKISQVIDEINLKYVDSVDRKHLIDQTIAGMLYKLDPHSAYIPVEEVIAANESLRGEFGGVGIKFMVLRDTIMVTNVLPGMPAEIAGIKAGDRIVKIDNKEVGGVKISNDSIMSLLKGKPGTIVNVSSYNPLKKELRSVKITRGMIGINSVEAAFMLSANTGYIKLARFSNYTDQEFVAAAIHLRKKGATKFILDLRGNGGGYLETAVAVADEFLKSGTLIVYTEGRTQPRKNFYATNRGLLKDVDLAVLIDQNSASASEIVAGAIQDNDRGTIIGRRSFGKGLVQQPVNLFDGSEIRLTVSRYYTPSGRGIQKPYGEDVDYESEYMSRYESGELYTPDSSIYENAEKFKTAQGRTVYGGGGIMPDIFISADSSGGSPTLATMNYMGIFSEFCFDAVFSGKYTFKHTDNLYTFVKNFEPTHQMVDDLIQLAQKNGIQVKAQELEHSKERIKQRIKIGITGNFFDNEGVWLSYCLNDKDVAESMKIFGDRIALK